MFVMTGDERGLRPTHMCEQRGRRCEQRAVLLARKCVFVSTHRNRLTESLVIVMSCFMATCWPL